jgi:hypothetical protein
MVYNPIFEEELDRETQLRGLKSAIKLRAGQDQMKDLCFKLSTFVKAHPVFTTMAIGAFGLSLASRKH